MFDKRRGSGTDFTKQEVMSLRTQRGLLGNLIGENKTASAGAAIWLPDTERFFMELSTMIIRAQQKRNARAIQFDSSDFFFRRLLEYVVTFLIISAVFTYFRLSF